jgi:tRNA-modifying protein YgfZ
MNTPTLTTLDHGAIVCDLDHLGLISFSGEEAQTFLQGQLTNDIRLVVPNRSQITGYCTAKGRLLATLLLWKSPDGYFGQLHGGIAAAVQKRLTMYVLRSKVNIADAANQLSRIGVAGETGAQSLAEDFGPLPPLPMDTLQLDGTTIIRLHGPLPRFEIIAPAERIAGLRNKLAETCTTADAAFWDWLEIRAGIPQIGPGTQEEFVPQMLNLDLLDGINFKKGCYTGQEIVARTHYLGKVKRRTHLAHADTPQAPLPGSPVFGSDGAEPVGMVVNAAPTPDGGCDLLAEIRLESVEAGPVFLQSRDGIPLLLLELPYAL